MQKIIINRHFRIVKLLQKQTLKLIELLFEPPGEFLKPGRIVLHCELCEGKVVIKTAFNLQFAEHKD